MPTVGMLTVGDTFPQYACQACVGTGKDDLKLLTNAEYAGSWVVYFFYPKDFTFVCPTEIAAFGKINKEFAARDAQLYGVSTDSEFVHLAWRSSKDELKDLSFPMLSATLFFTYPSRTSIPSCRSSWRNGTNGCFP